MLAVIVSASSALTDTFPSVTGVWAGSYRVAFPADHPKYPDQSVETSMELDIYQQESNLIWVINRWRRDANEPWVVEYATGSFDLEDRSDLVITEKGPAENEHVNTGVFTGELEDGDLYLNYIGLGDGITFSVKLSRQ
ncbi:hypothetical protein [Roseovarius albus]|nr:hypothetical protein [Roseovarius albus]